MVKPTGIGASIAVFAVLLSQSCNGSAVDEAGDVASSNWTVVWSDEFGGDTLDRTKWMPEESCWGGGNNERQCYTDRPENVRVDNGVLRLIAKPEPYSGTLYPIYHELFSDEQSSQEYTSGKVVTFGKADWKYGRFSARIKLPAGQGAWPAFWMMPTDKLYGEWPLSGEIDIMEAVNIETPCAECEGGVERRTSGALHFGDTFPANTYLAAKTEKTKEAGPANEWHVFTLEWAEGVIQWFVDDQIFMRIESDEWHSASDAAEGRPHAPFDQPFYLNINLAVGGNLSEKSNDQGFDEETFPAELLVDWVRVEQCEGDRETGRACLSNQKWDGALEGPSENQAS